MGWRPEVVGAVPWARKMAVQGEAVGAALAHSTPGTSVGTGQGWGQSQA